MDIKDDEIRYLDPVERMRIYSERNSTKNKNIEKNSSNDNDEFNSSKPKEKQTDSRSVTFYTTPDFFDKIRICSIIKNQSISSFVSKALEPYISDVLKNCDSESIIQMIQAETDKKISILKNK